MERYIAIDNVCAWPNLTRMPDGSIIATIFNQPTHGLWEGDVECWMSLDEGRTWFKNGVPAAHEPGTTRTNIAAGLANDGSLVVLAGGWSQRGPVGEATKRPLYDEDCLLPWICRSEDGGRSWERSGSVAPPPGRSVRITPFGDIVRLTDDRLGVCIYSRLPGNEHNSYFYSSSDDGRTWAVRGVIREGNTNETASVVLPDGRLLAVARTDDDQHLELFVSEDSGAKWYNLGPVTLGFQIPGHLLALKDGRLLLTYGIRNTGLYGVGVRLSADQGRTWQPPRILVNLNVLEDASCGPAFDCGYPSNVQSEDGAIVTAYYCNGIPSHQRYHMGIICWHIDK